MQRKDLLALEFYKKSAFHGSENGTRYRVEKHEEDDEKKLKVTIWPEPFSFEHTEDDKKISHLFDFSEEGLCNVADWINSNLL